MKDNIIALHKQNIAEAAKSLFLEKGFSSTSINDISAISHYSRRTIYKYFENKDDILYYLIIEGLEDLVHNIEQVVYTNKTFINRYVNICECMLSYYENYPISAQSVHQFHSSTHLKINPAVERIIVLGTKINEILSLCIKEGKEEGVLEESIDVQPAVYILSSNLNALFSLVTKKGSYLFTSLSMTKEQFLSYGYSMNLKGLLKEPSI